MLRFTFRLSLVGLALLAAAGTARADVCVAVDEARDTFTQADRAAAVLLLSRQFELAGETIAAPGCSNAYAVSHIALGQTITVTLSGPRGRREGTALGMEDLPALYSQMVRSIVTGRPMTGFNVIDRTNVTAAQASAERVGSDAVWYARLGYGDIFADGTHGAPSLGWGYRIEMDSFGFDISFLNFQMKEGDYSSYGSSSGVNSATLLKLEGLRFLHPNANATMYYGGGLSWGATSFGRGWHGNGLQGELTAGYEMPRASTLRMFLQADVTLPFYNVSATRYPTTPYRPGMVYNPTTEHRYAPSLTVSIGLGWQKNRSRRS